MLWGSFTRKSAIAPGNDGSLQDSTGRRKREREKEKERIRWEGVQNTRMKQEERVRKVYIYIGAKRGEVEVCSCS